MRSDTLGYFPGRVFVHNEGKQQHATDQSHEALM